mgnify:CR=1 FL=1
MTPTTEDRTMLPITFAFGLILTALGLYGYFGTDTTSPTALIPSVFGVILLVCGLIALKPAARKHAMHAAVAVSLLGALAAIGGLAARWSSASTEAKVSQVTLAVVLIIYLVMGIRSFIAARRARKLA